jgi:CGNR zinc finger
MRTGGGSLPSSVAEGALLPDAYLSGVSFGLAQVADRHLGCPVIMGRASDLLRGRVLIEMYNAQLIGTWRRLKVCHNARCHEVFFDQSKNNSRTWFDTAACANALNLRAYRERRKAARFSDLSERDPG